MIDQLIVGDKASFDDYGASLNKRKFSPPKKKEIKETVPFSNVTYDFTKINGEIYWEERELECIFEIMADTPEELERKKTVFSNWVMNIMQENIYDPFLPDFHYVGTFSDIDYEDEEGIEKTTITVKFSAYPYKIANNPTKYAFTVAAGEEITKAIVNSSAHRITPTITTNTAITISLDDVSYSVPAGETTDGSFMLKEGTNALTIKNASGTECNLTVSFFEEVF